MHDAQNGMVAKEFSFFGWARVSSEKLLLVLRMVMVYTWLWVNHTHGFTLSEEGQC